MECSCPRNPVLMLTHISLVFCVSLRHAYLHSPSSKFQTLQHFLNSLSIVAMAELAVIMSMITVTTTATSVLGVIKRRCGASQTISELARKCVKLVDKIHELLKILERSAHVPSNTGGISTALDHRREEFDAVLKDLEKMNRRTKRTHPIDRTEKFIFAQGWAKRMEALYNDLDRLRNGIENLVSNWDAAHFVVKKVEEIATIDATKESGTQAGMWNQHAENGWTRKGAVSVDQYLITMVKLTDENKAALNEHSYLNAYPLPEALYNASYSGDSISETCSIQLLQRSAELLHPEANYKLGCYYQHGIEVERNLELAVSYFKVASSRRHLDSMTESQE